MNQVVQIPGFQRLKQSCDRIGRASSDHGTVTGVQFKFFQVLWRCVQVGKPGRAAKPRVASTLGWSSTLNYIEVLGNPDDESCSCVGHSRPSEN